MTTNKSDPDPSVSNERRSRQSAKLALGISNALDELDNIVTGVLQLPRPRMRAVQLRKRIRGFYSEMRALYPEFDDTEFHARYRLAMVIASDLVNEDASKVIEEVVQAAERAASRRG